MSKGAGCGQPGLGPGAARLGGKRLGRLLVAGGTGVGWVYDAESFCDVVHKERGAYWTSRAAVVKPREL